MRTKYTSGPPITNKIDNEFIALPGDAGKRTTHYTRQNEELHLPHQDTHHNAFAETSLLTGEKLLQIAETHTNLQIAEMIKTHKGKAVAYKAVGGRIRNALAARAKAQGISQADAALALQQVRKSNGVPTRTKKEKVAVPASDDKNAAQAVAVAEDELSDMTEFESEVEA